VGGESRVSSVLVRDINNRWVNIMLRVRGSTVDLRVNETFVDSWTAPQRDYEGLRMMPDVDGDLRAQLIYARGLNDDEIDQLFGYLSAKRDGNYVQFRRGDVARYRIGDSG
jgi:hypothetical protein